MSPNQISRRNILTAGGVLAGLGVVGASAVTFTAADDRPPGADGFTAKTVPAGSDPLVLVDVDEMARNDAAKVAIRTLLDARQFDALPAALAGAFENGSQSPVNADSVGKLVLVGSNAAPNGGGAVVWADWTDDELIEVLESGAETDARTGAYEGRTLYTTGDASAAVLGDTEFALGSPATVRDIVDVWHGDAEPVGGETLDSFERTPLRAHVRFAFEDLRLACDAAASRSAAYDRITHVYGWVSSTGDAVQLRLRVEPIEASSEVATAVKADLGAGGGGGTESGSGGGDPALPPEVVESITVEHERDFVTVEYGTEPDESGNFVRDVIETTVCLIGRSG